MIDELTTTTGIAALVAIGVALASLTLAIVLAVRLGRVRRAQSAVLGGAESRDLVAHAERVEQGFVDLRDWVEDVLTGTEKRVAKAEQRIDGCVTHRSLIRYDAYGELTGHQSSSVALLDSRKSGIVISSIAHREAARVYVKQVTEGRSELDLSPEEIEAIETALTSSQPTSA